MGNVLTGHFGRPHWPRAETPEYEAQESGESEVIITPEKGPPPSDDEDERQPPYPPGAPPFTGEDVEDAGEPD
jgi:hypothetical protein